MFTFRELIHPHGRNPYLIDLASVAGQPKASLYTSPDRVSLAIQYKNGRDAEVCVTSEGESHRFLNALADFQKANA